MLLSCLPQWILSENDADAWDSPSYKDLEGKGSCCMLYINQTPAEIMHLIRHEWAAPVAQRVGMHPAVHVIIGEPGHIGHRHVEQRIAG